MALSKDEQAILDDIELGLRSAGPRLTVRPLAAGTRPGHRHRQLLIAFMVVAAGLALVLAGLISKVIAISIVGFLVMVAATVTAAPNPALLLSRSRRNAIGSVHSPSDSRQQATKLGRDTGDV
jgi:UPF0716 family protein affecting phage T7 exclusion